MKDATSLTEKYPGEDAIWTPCIDGFLSSIRPALEVLHVRKDQDDAIFRKRFSPLKIENSAIIKASPGMRFLALIDQALGQSLEDEVRRYSGTREIAGILPDLLLLDEHYRTVHFLENKPFQESKLTPAQTSAYVELVQLMNRCGIRTEYIFLAPLAWADANFQELSEIQGTLGDQFGIVSYESIFRAMASEKYDHPKIAENWLDYADESWAKFEQ